MGGDIFFQTFVSGNRLSTNARRKSTKKTKTYTNKGKMSFLGLYSFKMHWGEQDNCPVVGQVKI